MVDTIIGIVIVLAVVAFVLKDQIKPKLKELKAKFSKTKE
jgi:hypothetical protein